MMFKVTRSLCCVRREAITSLEELADKAKVQVWSAAALQAEAEAAAIAAEEAVSPACISLEWFQGLQDTRIIVIDL